MLLLWSFSKLYVSLKKFESAMQNLNSSTNFSDNYKVSLKYLDESTNLTRERVNFLVQICSEKFKTFC